MRDICNLKDVPGYEFIHHHELLGPRKMCFTKTLHAEPSVGRTVSPALKLGDGGLRRVSVLGVVNLCPQALHFKLDRSVPAAVARSAPQPRWLGGEGAFFGAELLCA